jgi:competence protein ComEC
MLVWFLVSVVIFLGVVMWQWPDRKLRVIGCDVGQGDAILITKGFAQILVDGGPPNGDVLTCLGHYLPFWDRRIELVVMTHPQLDHHGGLVEVLRRYQVEVFLTGDEVNESEAYERLVTTILEQDVVVTIAHQGMRLRVEGIELEVLWPKDMSRDVWKTLEAGDWQHFDGCADIHCVLGNFMTEMPGDLNVESVTILLRYGEFTALLTGDLNASFEEELVNDGLIGDIDLLKVAHHGSRTGESNKLLEVVKPEVAIVSVGKENRFGHPHESVMDGLRDHGVYVYRTDVVGDVVVVSDGTGWDIE